jgi:hypothetical protein
MWTFCHGRCTRTTDLFRPHAICDTQNIHMLRIEKIHDLCAKFVDITQYGILKLNRRFRKTFCLHFQLPTGSRALTAPCFALFLVCLTLATWRRRHLTPKRQLTFNGIHSVISKKIDLFMITDLRTSEHTKQKTFYGVTCSQTTDRYEYMDLCKEAYQSSLLPMCLCPIILYIIRPPCCLCAHVSICPHYSLFLRHPDVKNKKWAISSSKKFLFMFSLILISQRKTRNVALYKECFYVTAETSPTISLFLLWNGDLQQTGNGYTVRSPETIIVLRDIVQITIRYVDGFSIS